jgi:hypothetical protein
MEGQVIADPISCSMSIEAELHTPDSVAQSHMA